MYRRRPTAGKKHSTSTAASCCHLASTQHNVVSWKLPTEIPAKPSIISSSRTPLYPSLVARYCTPVRPQYARSGAEPRTDDVAPLTLASCTVTFSSFFAAFFWNEQQYRLARGQEIIGPSRPVWRRPFSRHDDGGDDVQGLRLRDNGLLIFVSHDISLLLLGVSIRKYPLTWQVLCCFLEKKQTLGVDIYWWAVRSSFFASSFLPTRDKKGKNFTIICVGDSLPRI